MLTIRKEQKKVLDAQMQERFIQKVLAHLREVFPEQAKAQGESNLRGTVETGVRRAAEYGITQEREVVMFIDLIMGMGTGFERQGQNRWMFGILTRSDLAQREKMDTIYARLMPGEPPAGA